MGLPDTLKQLGIVERFPLADGDVIAYDATRQTFVTTRPAVKLLADATARAANAPAYTGQIGLQLDTGEVFVGSSALTWSAYKPERVVADATARGLAVPTYVGQLLLQLDTGGLYSGTATTAGSWTLVTATAA